MQLFVAYKNTVLILSLTVNKNNICLQPVANDPYFGQLPLNDYSKVLMKVLTISRLSLLSHSGSITVGSSLSSIHVKFKQLNANIFITCFLVTAPAYFDVIRNSCVESPVKPWQVWWVTTGAASKAVLTIPHAVVPGSILAVAVVVLSNKGRWWRGNPVWVTETSTSMTSSIRPEVVSRGAISDGEAIDVGMVNGLRRV